MRPSNSRANQDRLVSPTRFTIDSYEGDQIEEGRVVVRRGNRDVKQENNVEHGLVELARRRTEVKQMLGDAHVGVVVVVVGGGMAVEGTAFGPATTEE